MAPLLSEILKNGRPEALPKGLPTYIIKKCVFLKNGRPEALPKGLPTHIIKTECFFSEKLPAGGPAEGTPYLYKKVCFIKSSYFSKKCHIFDVYIVTNVKNTKKIKNKKMSWGPPDGADRSVSSTEYVSF